ncbi:MAG: translation initiation factor IF-2 subunit alpha [Promethearchaeota archaeon]|nr:MAG: translation initiation factor IF-2 subunit alpha [Candidatus Lokiarchaeota archaeon]
MVVKRREWPEVGEFVIGTATNIEGHGAYVELEEYNNKEGLIHISEIASSWVRNIRNYVRENQKVVVKVIDVNPAKGHINLSLRRVNQNQRQAKRKEWKRAQKAEGLLKLALEEVNEGKTLEDAYREFGWELEVKYGEIYTAFETIKKEKIGNLTELGIPEIWAEPLLDIIKQYIEIPSVTVSGTFQLNCFSPNGIEVIKKALKKAEKSFDNEKNIEIKIITIGAPKYKVDLTAPDYKTAESKLDQIVDVVIDDIETNDGRAEFYR